MLAKAGVISIAILLLQTSHAASQPRTDADCVHFFYDQGPRVRNTCANVKIIVRWRISGGAGCLDKGWGRVIVDAGEVAMTSIGDRCLIDFWACDYHRWTAGQCHLPQKSPGDDEEDEANLRYRQMEWEREQRDRGRRDSEADEDARAEEAYRADLEHQERQAREREEAEGAASATSQAVLNGLGQILQGMSQSGSGGYGGTTGSTSPAPPPTGPAYVPEPTYAPTGSRSQTLTPRNTGSGLRSGTGSSSGPTTCIDAAPISGSGRPRC